jgi:hypothetical protein
MLNQLQKFDGPPYCYHDYQLKETKKYDVGIMESEIIFISK